MIMVTIHCYGREKPWPNCIMNGLCTLHLKMMCFRRRCMQRKIVHRHIMYVTTDIWHPNEAASAPAIHGEIDRWVLVEKVPSLPPFGVAISDSCNQSINQSKPIQDFSPTAHFVSSLFPKERPHTCTSLTSTSHRSMPMYSCRIGVDV